MSLTIPNSITGKGQMLKRIVILVLIIQLLTVTAGISNVWRTPPLSEVDFTFSFDESASVPFSIVIRDLEYTDYTRTEGVLSAIPVEGQEPDPGVAYGTLSNEIVNIDALGRYFAKVSGTAIFTITVPGLTKQTSRSVSVGGTPFYTTGTLGKAWTDQINNAIDGVSANDTTKALFINRDEVAGTYEWNSACWAAGFDLTCMAPWRSGVFSPTSALWLWPVTAISPRHIVCGHVGTAVGETYHWFAADNTMVSRTVTAVQQIPATSYYVALLDSDLPATIHPAYLLPADFRTAYIPGIRYSALPCIATDQEKKAIIRSIADDGFTLYNLYFSAPLTAGQLSFHESIVGGDSSSPVFIVINDGTADRTILVTSWYTATMGLDYSQYITEINAAMSTLQGGVDPYQVQTIDLSQYPSY